MYKCVHVCACVHGGQESILDVLPHVLSTLYFWGGVSHWPETYLLALADWLAGWLASPRDWSISAFPVLTYKLCVRVHIWMSEDKSVFFCHLDRLRDQRVCANISTHWACCCATFYVTSEDDIKYWGKCFTCALMLALSPPFSLSLCVCLSPSRPCWNYYYPGLWVETWTLGLVMGTSWWVHRDTCRQIQDLSLNHWHSTVFPSDCQSTTNPDLALGHVSPLSPIKVPLQVK